MILDHDQVLILLVYCSGQIAFILIIILELCEIL